MLLLSSGPQFRGPQQGSLDISLSGKLQIRVFVPRGILHGTRHGGFEGAIALQDGDDFPMGDVVKGAFPKAPSRSTSVPAA